MIKHDLQYLQIYQRVRFRWLSSKETLRIEAEQRFQQQVQENVRSDYRFDNHMFRTTYIITQIDKDLSDVLALSADTSGDLYGKQTPHFM